MWMWMGVALMAVAQEPDKSLVLSSKGASRAIIVLAGDASAPERVAAEELQSHLESVTGSGFPIVMEGDQDGTSPVRICVGPCDALRKSFPDLRLEALGCDGIVMKTSGNVLFLAGGRPRGALYAVFTFLEDVVGCRWWTSKESFIPKKPTLKIPELDVTYTPKLEYREAFYRDAFEPVFAARCKLNGHFERIPAEYGGHNSILGWCHTFFQLLPPEQYFDSHPDWYSEIGGKRVKDGQLCLTHAEMRRELTSKALEWIRKDPGAGFISISQNDWAGRCECPACLDIEAREGSPSGPIIAFVNAVAEEIEKEFPKMWVETLAYSYSRQAPKMVRPRKNVVVRLCSIECSFSQPLATGPQNETFKRDMEAWSALSQHLYIWDYVTNFRNYLLPHPNMRVLASNIRFFVDHKALGLFEQGDSGSSCGDFVALRAWLFSHLMWDPSRDDKALISEFLTGYYGPAAKALQSYLDLTHDAVEKAGVHLGCFRQSSSDWLNPEDLVKATEMFDRAEKSVADDPALTDRVKRARVALDFAWLTSQEEFQVMAKLTDKPFKGMDDPQSAADKFIRTVRSFDVGQYREGRPFDELEPSLRSMFRPQAPLPAGFESLSERDVIDIQDNAFDLYGDGSWASLVDDPLASDGKAARMTTDHTQWAVQYHPPDYFRGLGKWRCVFLLRCQAKANGGNVCQLGLYDEEGHRDLMSKVLPMNEVSLAGYQAIELGIWDLSDDLYFWVAPLNNQEAVEAIWIDRILLVRDKKQ